MTLGHSIEHVGRRAGLALGLVIVLAGCSSEGPSRFAISGTVTFQGKSVPVGFIRFEPDTTKGNKGPAAGSPIKDGKYSVPSSKGVLGGHYRIVVDGFDGIPTVVDGEKAPDGKLLFSNQLLLAELPQADTTWNVELPSAGRAAK